MNNVKKIYGDKVTFTSNEYEAVDGADALLIATEWSEFRNPDFAKVAAALKNKIIFDGRNLYDLAQMRKLGFYYESIGRDIVS
jgi:UDPglucose 6-dehydrogenase